jgi:hypothetical protein
VSTALAVFVFSLLLLTGAAHSSAEGGERPYDDGGVLRSLNSVHELPIPLAVDFFTDRPPASWSSQSIPVAICTQQSNRPASVTAEEFRDAVAAATSMWTASGLAIGYDYTGDCESGPRWEFNNGITEIGFDDFRNAVHAQSAAVATGTWTSLFGTKEFIEFDVVLDHRLDIPLQCFESVIAHEFGHVLGLGHSDDVRDLMFPSFNPANVDTCPTTTQPSEVEALQVLYDENAPPIVEEPGAIVLEAGVSFTVEIVAEDPEGDQLSFQWEQLAGEPVPFEVDGPLLLLDLPDDVGAELRFLVTVFDSFRHATSVEVLIGIDDNPTPPEQSPSLVSLRAAADGRDAVLRWTKPDGATSLEVCSGDRPDCSQTAGSEQAISWESIVTQAGSPAARRIFSGGARTTSAAACNAAGCGPATAGPMAGGMRWVPWDIDFDYIGMAMDLPGIRLTIGGVVNLSETPRDFSIYTGTPTNPLDRAVRRCGTLDPGESCLAVLGPNDRGHGSIVTIVSSAFGTPTTEHRVEVR